MLRGEGQFRRFAIDPLEAAVLILNVLRCPDAENDADHTVQMLVAKLDEGNYVSKSALESALYCCNMNDEYYKEDIKAGKDPEVAFYHPFGWNIDKFIYELLPITWKFDKEYNQIRERKKDGLDK